jgi:hypothetical protein
MAARTRLIIGIKIVAVVLAFVLPAMPQSLAYHDFADHRTMFGIPNFLDVVSNVAFVVAGIAGLVIVLGTRAQFEAPRERWPYAVFFLGLLLTGFGSGYYHLAPDNETLFWDRLPMTIAFMGLVTSQIVDRMSVRAGLAMLPPMLLLGAASVFYWRATERAGVGNVMPYGVLQGYSVLVLLLLAVLKPSRYTRGTDLYWVFGWYVLAKLLETFDRDIYVFGHVISGHTLKHFSAAIAGFAVCHMLMRRKLVAAGVAPAAGAVRTSGSSAPPLQAG